MSDIENNKDKEGYVLGELVNKDVPPVPEDWRGMLPVIYAVLAFVFSFTGWSWAKDASNWETLALIVVPLVTSAWGMISYINSRGKVISNAIWSNAAKDIAAQPSIDSSEMAVATFAGGGKLGKILDVIKTGTGIGKVLLPGKLGQVINVVDGAVGGIQGQSVRTITDDEIIESFKIMMDAKETQDKYIQSLEKRIILLESK